MNIINIWILLEPLTYMYVAVPARIEIEYYSVRISSASPSLTRYSNKLLLGEGLILATWTYMYCIRYSCVYTAHMSPTLSGSSALLRVKLSDALKIHNRIIFDFYPELPHICVHVHDFVFFHYLLVEILEYIRKGQWVWLDSSICVKWLKVTRTRLSSKSRNTCVAIPNRNRILFRCIFRVH